MPETLLESELFGHVRGAFTDASADRQGLLVSANGGTVFLDEVGDMPAAVQPKLLRALEERTVRPIGTGKEIPFDTRIVAATHRDLAAAVDAGTFRADLFFRLNVIEMNLPPLRVRGTDILLLAQKFLTRYAELNDRAVTGFTSAVAQRLLDYRWPGNVRELKNCIERAVALTRTAELTVDDLPPAIQAFQPHRTTEDRVVSPDSLVPLEVVERAHVERVLDVVNGNKREAARILGLDRKTLYRKLEKWAAPQASPAAPAVETAEPEPVEP
jgi:two-component system response regulator HydG